MMNPNPRGMLDELGPHPTLDKYYTSAQQKRKFHKDSFRWIRVPSNRRKKVKAWILVACPKKQWNKLASTGNQCKVGMEKVVIYHPTKKKSKRKSVRKKGRAKSRRKMAANPLLMTLPNPLPAALRRLPKKVLNDPEFRNALKKYVEFHGTYPTSVTKKKIPVGGKKNLGRMYGVKLGKAPDVTYRTTNSKSNKYGDVYLHEYENEPDRIVDSSGKIIMDVLGKGTKVKDWVHG